MSCHSTFDSLDWSPILSQMHRVNCESLPTYPGELKAVLLNHAGLGGHPKGDALYQLAQELAQLTTYCDPEIVYWFSRLMPLIGE